MPELPDITVYIDALERRILGAEIVGVRIANPFLLRTVDPPATELVGRRVEALRRIGKRIAFGVEGGIWAVLHLMIAGRLQWAAPQAALPGRKGLAALDFEAGTLILTEQGSKKRASLHLLRGAAALDDLDPGGAEPLEIDRDTFAAVLRSENHTLKRALTDPHLLSGIGNAYSDEILYAARLSPVTMTPKLSEAEVDRLYEATRSTLLDWIERLRSQTGEGWPKKVTAFHKEMAVHGKYRAPCPRCGGPVQRIVHASNETNYCPTCQTEGRLLADRALSQVLKKDWPKTLEELERRRGGN